MEPEPIEHVVRNVDARLMRVEQILPTLATKEEMRAAIAEEGERSRRHTNVLIEQVRSDIGLLTEHLSAVMVKLEGR